MAEDRSRDRPIPKSRLSRSARFGARAGLEGARFAGAKASGVVRSKEKRKERMDDTALASAARLVDTLGTMKGAAMKMGQLASFIDTDYLPDEYRELYQDKLAALRTSAPAMPWEKVRKVLEQEYDEPCEELFESIQPQAFAAASIGQVHRGVLHDGRRVAVKIQYPGVDAAIRADLSNAGMILRLAKALAPGLDAKAAAAELRERVLEELDYEYEAQNQRRFARAYRGHPFIHVPDVVTRLSRDRVLVTEYVQGAGFDDVKQLDQEARDRFGEIVFRFYLGSIYQLNHFNADAHPGNYVLMDDGRVAFLDFGMTKCLDPEQIRLEEEVVKARLDHDPERLREKLHELGFLRNPKRIDAERLMAHVDAVGGWYFAGRRAADHVRVRDGRDLRDLGSALGLLRAHAARERARERADGPPHGGRRARGAGPAARAAQLAPHRARVVVRRRAPHRAGPHRARVLGPAGAAGLTSPLLYRLITRPMGAGGESPRSR